MNSLIVRHGDVVAVTQEAFALRDAALESSALIAVVRTEEDQRVAVDAQRMIKTLLDHAEAARKSVKEPVLDLGRDIDAKAKEFTAELKEEYTRLSTTIGDYQQEQLMIARRAEMQRAIELKAIEDEKAAAITKAAIATNDKEVLAAEIVKQDQLATQKREMLAPVPLPAKAKGQAVRQPWRWEPVNMDMLYKMHPGLVTMTTNAREINELILRLAAIGKPEINGLRIWQETVSGVRANERKAIDV